MKQIKLAPSILAASRSSSGTASVAYTQIRYRPNGWISDGMMIAHGVSVSPILENIRNVGTASAVPGTATAPAQPRLEWLKSMAIVAKLPELRQQVRELEDRLKALETKVAAKPAARRNPPPKTSRAAKPKAKLRKGK